MSDLDKKLEEIIDEAGGMLAGATKGKAEKIKQAFKDAGYVQKEWRSSGMVNGERYEFKEVLTKEEWERQAVKDGWVRVGKLDGEVKTITAPQFDGSEIVYMTGQEWYDKFEKLIRDRDDTEQDFGRLRTEDVLADARKAAGIE